MKIALGIVLYNPDINKINKIVKEYCKNIQYIFLVDNFSNNIKNIEENVKGIYNVILLKNERNEGIAKALNQLLDMAYSREVDCLLTLDQDSFLNQKDLMQMKEYINDNVAIVCPEIIDLNKKKNKKLKEKYEKVNRCITSGSLMNLKLCKKVGNFDEKMFIDYVDFDYSKRITIEGYNILKIKNCFLRHEIGKRTTKRFFGIYVYPTNHSSTRVYYYFRNMHYYYLKFKKQMTYKEKLNEFIRIVWKYISIILYENDKLEKIKKAKEGFFEAKKMI